MSRGAENRGREKEKSLVKTADWNGPGRTSLATMMFGTSLVSSTGGASSGVGVARTAGALPSTALFESIGSSLPDGSPLTSSVVLSGFWSTSAVFAFPSRLDADRAAD